MNEEWRVIDIAPNYEVSNLGRVRSYYSRFDKSKVILDEPHLLHPGVVKGYLQVLLKTNTGKHSVYVHRLVAKAFLPNSQNKPDVNHIDGDKMNNKLNNLEWCTESENLLHAIKVTKTVSVPKHQKAVKCLETGQVFSSTREAAKHIGLSSKNRGIEKVCRKEKYCHTCGGYHWSYI